MSKETKLFPYQEQGAAFLSEKKWALLADEMGLGKTIQAIRGLDRIRAKKVIIIAPSVALINWYRELGLWSEVGREFLVAKKLKDRPRPGQSLICSFEYATANFKYLSQSDWDCLIVDEAHYLKATTAKRTRAVMGRKGIIRAAKRTWLLTGTPAPNNASELWVMLYTFGLTPLGYDEFIKEFCIIREATYGTKIVGTRQDRIPKLRQLLKPTILRRRKMEVLQELPPISYGHVVVEPGPVDFERHFSFIEYTMSEEGMEEIDRKLRNERRLIENVWMNMKVGNSQALQTISSLADSVSTHRRYVGLQKLQPAIDLVTKELESGNYEKIVIFAIHRDVIEGLRVGLRKYGTVTLYGKSSAISRQTSIDKFMNKKNTRVFIGNIGAAGVAITLTSAHHVLFVEQDWVPGNNAQAVMRCHRIGQQNPVTVRFLGVADSIDERIMYLLKKKTRDLTAIFDQDEKTRIDNIRKKFEFEKID